MFLEASINIFVISVLTAYLAYIWQNSKKTEMLYCYSIMHLLTIFVLLSSFIVKIAPAVQIKWISMVIAYTIKTCFDISFFYYGYYYNTKKHLTRKAAVLISAFPLSSVIIILTNSCHHLFIKELSTSGVNYGAMYYMILAVGYGFQFLGAIYMILSLVRTSKPSLYRIFIMIITLFAFTLQFLYVSNILYIAVDINPILIFLIFTFLFFGAYRLGLLNTLSIGVIRSLQMFTDAVLVLDVNGEVVLKNEACDVLDEDMANYVVTQCRSFLDQFSELTVKDCKKEMEISYKDRTFTISIRPVRTILKKIAGYVCIIHDDTTIIGLIEDLKEKNEQLVQMNESIGMLAEDIKRLAIIEERNVLAKEIHDVLGHSLNLAFHILESNKAIVDEQPEKAIQRLKQAIIDIDRGIGEVEVASSGAKTSQPDGLYTLRQRLKVMTERLKDVGVNIEIAAIDDLRGCNDSILQTIYRICQEASTNSIKHGQASQVIISIRRKEQEVVLHIVDNGRGCDSFKKGNGLAGMEDRIKEVGGSISFGPFDDDNGFLVHAVIPVEG